MSGKARLERVDSSVRAEGGAVSLARKFSSSPFNELWVWVLYHMLSKTQDL